MRQAVATHLLNQPRLLILAITLLLIAGLAAWSNLPRTEDPRITTRNATVITALPGATAERIEALVTKKLEDGLREIAEIKTLESTSRGGISLIAIELDDSVDASNNQQIFARIRNQLVEIERELPPEASKPELEDKRGAVAYSLIAALVWKGQDAPQVAILDRLAEELADRFRNLPGTEKVVNFGAVDEEIRVTVDFDELAALGLTVADVANRLAAADPKTPAGTLRTDERQLRLEVGGEFDVTARVASVPLVADERGVVSVGDVSTVTKSRREPPTEIAYADGHRAVLVGVRTRAAVKLNVWAEQARAQLAEFSEGIGQGIDVQMVFDQSRYTSARLGELGSNLAAGAGLVVLVVFFAMGWRAALVVGAALPLSASLTLFGLDWAGEPIHQMSIFGMIIAIGLLIDNAIVMTDEVRVRLDEGQAPARAVEGAVKRLFRPLAASTLTTILGFMPIFLLPGNVGDFVGPIAIAVILALIASFIVALTIIPALAARFVRPAKGGRRWWRNGCPSRRIGDLYRALLHAAVRRPWLTVLACLVLPITGFVAASTLGNQFFPAADRDQFEIQVWLAPDAPVTLTAETVLAMEKEIRASGDVRSVSWVAGGSSPPVYYNQLRNQDDNPSYARGTVLAGSPQEARRLVGSLQDLLSDRFPQARVVVRAFGQGPPIPAPVSLRILGPDPDKLRVYGEDLRRLMHQIPAITHTKASIQGGEPKLWLEANEQEARFAGLTLGAIATQFQTALEGAQGGRVLEDLEDLPVRVRYADRERGDSARIATLPLVSPNANGAWVPAQALGDLALRPELASITRRNGERENTVQGWLRPDALPIEVTQAIQALIADGGLNLERGYRLEIAGDSAEQGDAIGLLLAYAPLLGTLMLATLVVAFNSFRLAALIGFVAVLSVGLGLLSLWLGGYPLGFNPILGTAGLVGVAINASIVVLAAIRDNPQAHLGEVAAIVHETLGATRHIVATTLTTVGGFLPLLLFTRGEFWPPLAIVIAGGVGLSITLGLVLTPAAYRLLVRGEKVASIPAAATA